MCKYVKRFGPSRAHKVPQVFGTDARTDAQTHRCTDMIPISPNAFNQYQILEQSQHFKALRNQIWTPHMPTVINSLKQPTRLICQFLDLTRS